MGAQRFPYCVQHLPGPKPLCAHAAGEYTHILQMQAGAPRTLPVGSSCPPGPLAAPRHDLLFWQSLQLPAVTAAAPDVLSCPVGAVLRCCSVSQIEYGGQCHISNRPYTVFRWKPGNDARYKKTIICQEVAKAKNVCQVRAGGCC